MTSDHSVLILLYFSLIKKIVENLFHAFFVKACDGPLECGVVLVQILADDLLQLDLHVFLAVVLFGVTQLLVLQLNPDVFDGLGKLLLLSPGLVTNSILVC